MYVVLIITILYYKYSRGFKWGIGGIGEELQLLYLDSEIVDRTFRYF